MLDIDLYTIKIKEKGVRFEFSSLKYPCLSYD